MRLRQARGSAGVTGWRTGSPPARGWDAWKAIDETLARAVTVFTFASGFPRIGDVVTAARAASRLTDPRLAQVFDVEDAWDQEYIVMEWAAGETLGDLLSAGPLEPFRAARMIAEAAAALSSAHGAGVAHMCLSPGSVRWSPTGEVKVVGLGIDAALSGIVADDPVLEDTEGLGRLLYAALTGCWPGPDYAPLPPAHGGGRRAVQSAPGGGRHTARALGPDLPGDATEFRDGTSADPLPASSPGLSWQRCRQRRCSLLRHRQSKRKPATAERRGRLATGGRARR